MWTYIFELLFLHEAITAWSIAGTGLIIGFMIFVGYIKMKEMDKIYDEAMEEALSVGASETSAMLYASLRNVGTSSIRSLC